MVHRRDVTYRGGPRSDADQVLDLDGAMDRPGAGWTTSAEYWPRGSIVARDPVPWSLHVMRGILRLLDATVVKHARPSLSSGPRAEETTGHRWAGPLNRARPEWMTRPAEVHGDGRASALGGRR